MNELTLYAKPIRDGLILSRKDLKKGIFRENEWGSLVFTNIGVTIYEAVLEFNNLSRIRFAGGYKPGLYNNWDVEITNHHLFVTLISRQYYIPWVDTLDAVAIKMIIIGNNESFTNFFHILNIKFKKPPTNFQKWHKFEKYFKVTRSEVEKNWKKVMDS